MLSIMFPAYLHSLVAFCLPSRRRLQRYTERIHQFLVPMIEDRRKRQAQGEVLDGDIITWMMELANDNEYPAANIAQRYIYTIIGSMHTVTAAVVDTIYDLCARPEYIEPLREEALGVLKTSGGWQKETSSRLLMMDSFMKEVQRVNPPSARTFSLFVICSLQVLI
jgi:ent-kaurene oxidase